MMTLELKSYIDPVWENNEHIYLVYINTYFFDKLYYAATVTWLLSQVIKNAFV